MLPHSVCFVNGCDSRVVVGAFGKGRSSSHQLNGVLRSILGWLVLGRVQWRNFFIPTDLNVADDPTRSRPLRARAPVAAHLVWLLRPSRTPHGLRAKGVGRDSRVCLEVFAGHGGLTLALGEAGLHTLRPREAFPSQGVYVAEDDFTCEQVVSELLALVVAGVFFYVHFGIPCTKWGTLHVCNGGTRRKNRPEGDGSRRDEIEANALATTVARICAALCSVGSHYSIENPLSSHIWGFGPIAALKGVAVDFDQCMYGLRPPVVDPSVDVRFRKATRLLTSLSSLATLRIRCDGRHSHHVVQGRISIGGKSVAASKLAGRYPPKLCRAWAKAVACGCK